MSIAEPLVLHALELVEADPTAGDHSAGDRSVDGHAAGDHVGLGTATVRAFLAGEVDRTFLPEPAWGPIGREVFERTYARQITATPPWTGSVVDSEEPEHRLESWAEVVRRVVNGSLSYVPRSSWLEGEDVELFRLIYTFKAIPAGRHLWVTGTDSAHMSKNCWAAGFSPRTSDHFRYAASRLFEGGGVGGNYSADMMDVLPPVLGRLDVVYTCEPFHQDYDQIIAAAGEGWDGSCWAATHAAVAHPELAARVEFGPVGSVGTIRVEDTREGWVDAWTRLIDLAGQPGQHQIVFDVSDIRPHGAPLRTFGGTASGPTPLVAATRGIAAVLNGAYADGVVTGSPRRITGLEAMQMDHEIAASVVAGGARRSARISLMSWRDPDIFSFIHCKADQSKHWSTNISVEIDSGFAAAVADGDERATAVLHAVADGMAANGEPGLVDTEAHSRDEPRRIRITNPCGEASLDFDPLDAAGESCNLGSVDLARFGTDEVSARRAFALMARFLFRATLNPHPDEPARRIEEGNRRIGVGIMGLQGWAAAHGVRLSGLPETRYLLSQLAGFSESARAAADSFADHLQLPRPVKVTAVAPTGSIAQLSGTTPGIHPVMARYFIRRVRYADADPGIAQIAARGFTVVDDVYAANTKVVEFIVRDSILDHYPVELIEQADELSAGQFFDVIASVQRYFCGYGDGQAVSATAQIPAGTDPKSLVADMKRHLGFLKGLTVFPAVSRELSPYEVLSEDQYIERSMSGPVMPSGDSNDGECASGACPIR